MPRMDTKQHALAAEIRAEMAAQRISTKVMYQAVGVSSSAWNNYFVKCTRDVPIAVVIAVAGRLGMPASELLRRAEDRAAHLAQGNGPRVDVDKILRDAPHLAKVREEGQRLMGGKANNGTS